MARKKGSLNKRYSEKTITQRIYQKTFEKVNNKKGMLDFKTALDLIVDLGISEYKRNIR